MNKVIFLGTLLCILCCAFTLSAQDCSKADNTLAIVACHEERYEKADKELNKVYGEAMESLSLCTTETERSSKGMAEISGYRSRFCNRT